MAGASAQAGAASELNVPEGAAEPAADTGIWLAAGGADWAVPPCLSSAGHSHDDVHETLL